MTRIVIDDGRTTRRRRSRKYPGIFGTIFEFFSMCLAGFRLFKRTKRFSKKVTGETTSKPKRKHEPAKPAVYK